MSTYGRTVQESTGRQIMVTADGAPEWKPGGVTIDWATVAAVSGSDVTLPDETVVKVGAKYLRFGQVITKITQRETQTATITGSPTGGTFTLALTRNGVTRTTSALAHNASAAAVQAALEALDNIGAGNVTVTLASSVYTIIFAFPENVAQLVAAHAFTGGISPNITVATTVEGTAAQGKFGPYDPSATDGRQTRTRGEAYILNETVLEAALGSDHPPVVEGGVGWKSRVLMTTGTASLAAGPTVAEVETLFPRLRYAQD